MKALAATVLTAAAVLALASTEVGAAHADGWWHPTRVIPANTQMLGAPSGMRPEAAPGISPLASPLGRPVDPEFCDHYGYSDPDQCAREWANYLTHLPY